MPDPAPNELRDFAERLLLGTRLEDKLWTPARLVDHHPGPAARVPEAPGRPPALMLASARPRRDDPEVRFPSRAQLEDPAGRGRLMHFFANHELLALELMALALLRFVDAPPAFRRGLATTITEEQDHLRRYLQHMQAAGVPLGELPLSGFLWRVMAPLHNPLEFTAHMALTFEQANLDFATHYAGVLRQVGDEAGAQLLDRVHTDEIAHVRRGLVWFERWRPRGPSLLEAHARALRPPMTPRRARGIGFETQARVQAGFPADYIEALASYSASRGRAPDLYLFDPSCELELAALAPGRSAYTPDAATRAMTHDLETLPMFIASEDDEVLVRQRPRPAFLQPLLEVGFANPQWVEAPLDDGPVDPAGLPSERLGTLCPWGWSPRIQRILAAVAEHAEFSNQASPEQLRTLYAKTTAARVLSDLLLKDLEEPGLERPENVGAVLSDPVEVYAQVQRLHTQGHATSVVKAPYGTSGRNMQRLLHGRFEAGQQRWLERTLAQHDEVVVEPWLDRVCDLSLRMSISRDGQAVVHEIGRVLSDERGQFLGAVLGRPWAGLSQPVVRFLHGQGRDPSWLRRVFNAVAQRVAATLRPLGHIGPTGVDAFVHREHDGTLRLRPVVEFNPRYSLGYIAGRLERRIARGASGLWLLVRLRDLEAAGFPDASAWVEALQHRAPLSFSRPAGAGPSQPAVRPRLTEGALVTNDPQRAQAVLGVLLVGRTPQACLSLLGEAAPTIVPRVVAALTKTTGSRREPVSRSSV